MLSKNFWKILLPWSARIFCTPLKDLRRDGVVKILRQTYILWMLFISMFFFWPLSMAQTMRLEPTAILLNFLIFRFFLHLTANFVSDMATQLARKSSSAFLRAFLSGKLSSSYAPLAFLFWSSRTIVSVPYDPSGKIIVFVITFGASAGSEVFCSSCSLFSE